MSKVNLYNEDCIQAMKKTSAHTVDLVLTDPPYNLGNFMKSRDTNLKKMRDNFFVAAGWDNLDFDKWTESMDKFFSGVARVLKPGGSVIILWP